MEHKYQVRFAKDDPETPATVEEQVALARESARKLGVPNAESQPIYRVGRNSHTGEAWASWSDLGRAALGSALSRTPGEDVTVLPTGPARALRPIRRSSTSAIMELRSSGRTEGVRDGISAQ
jgi:hypothetical protein